MPIFGTCSRCGGPQSGCWSCPPETIEIFDTDGRELATRGASLIWTIDGIEVPGCGPVVRQEVKQEYVDAPIAVRLTVTAGQYDPVKADPELEQAWAAVHAFGAYAADFPQLDYLRQVGAPQLDYLRQEDQVGSLNSAGLGVLDRA